MTLYTLARSLPPSRYRSGGGAEPWMYSNDIRDPWGTPYAMTCGVASIVVSSAGEDRKFGTSDDIRSNE